MSQSSYIAGGLVLGFVLYLAAKGRLKTYGQALFGPSPTATSDGKSGGIGGAASDFLEAGKTVAALAPFVL